MNIKPKEILVDLPAVFPFKSEDDVHSFVSAINTIVHGKVKVKYEILGWLDENCMCIVYIQRNFEYQELYNEFIEMIQRQEREMYEQ